MLGGKGEKGGSRETVRRAGKPEGGIWRETGRRSGGDEKARNWGEEGADRKVKRQLGNEKVGRKQQGRQGSEDWAFEEVWNTRKRQEAGRWSERDKILVGGKQCRGTLKELGKYAGRY